MTFSDRQMRASDENVISLNVRQYRQPLDQRLGHHADLFAHQRRSPDDVHWLKENAEFLNITQCIAGTSQAVTDVYAEIYGRIDRMLGQFPQYYRFMLSICLDLEDLGQDGETGDRLCSWVARHGLAGAELSDLQRAEAVRLLARRDQALPDDGLRDRLLAFARRSATFAIPNRKAAYELTHILFYLSDYGRVDPQVDDDVIQSLTFTGILAYLDQDYDLLAEVCTALRYAGQTPSLIWEGAVLAALGSVRAVDVRDPVGTGGDMYHTYLVTSWLAGLAGRPAMPMVLQSGPSRVEMAPAPARPMARMAELAMNGITPDWMCARAAVTAGLEEDGVRILDAAEQSSPWFDVFFEGFARAVRP